MAIVVRGHWYPIVPPEPVPGFPEAPCGDEAQLLEDEEMQQFANATLVAAGVVVCAGLMGLIGLGLVCKWLMESLR